MPQIFERRRSVKGVVPLDLFDSAARALVVEKAQARHWDRGAMAASSARPIGRERRGILRMVGGGGVVEDGGRCALVVVLPD